MPLAVTIDRNDDGTHSTPEGSSPYRWTQESEAPATWTRELTKLEQMFTLFNGEMLGQNCPFMGGTISIQARKSGVRLTSVTKDELLERSILAAYQTRFRYPTIAASIEGRTKAVYSVSDNDGVWAWASRITSLVVENGGWPALRERLSQDSMLPTTQGDCCMFYIIVPKDEETSELAKFDFLMHTHHGLIDGSGVRVVLNEFLSRLAEPLPTSRFLWGLETSELHPASVLLERHVAAEPIEQAIAESRLKPFDRPDVGLPVYEPSIISPSQSNRGSLVVRHTFTNTLFLSRLKAKGRQHGVKLASMVHSALLQATYERCDHRPDDVDGVLKSGSPMDLRNGFLKEEFCERSRYVNSAVSIQPIHVPCSLFQRSERSGGLQPQNLSAFWKAARCISDQWDLIKSKTSVGQDAEKDAEGVLRAWDNKKLMSKSSAPAAAPTIALPKPRTCPYLVMDAPGSQGLTGIYAIQGTRASNACLVLEDYQLATDQMQAVVSARAHSWLDLLTLCIVYNKARNPTDKMQDFLDHWVRILQSVADEEYNIPKHVSGVMS